MENRKRRIRDTDPEAAKSQSAKKLRVLSDVSDSSDDEDLGPSQSQKPSSACKSDEDSDSSLDLSLPATQKPNSEDGHDSDDGDKDIRTEEKAAGAASKDDSADSDLASLFSDDANEAVDSQKEKKARILNKGQSAKKPGGDESDDSTNAGSTEKQKAGTSAHKQVDTSSDSSDDDTVEDKENRTAKRRGKGKKKEAGPDTQAKKAQKKKQTNTSVDAHSPPGKKKKKQENPAANRLKRLNRYARLAGIGIPHGKLFKGIDHDRKKVKLLKEYLVEKGISEPFTIEKCKEFKLKREQEKELEELEMNVIIEADEVPEGRRVTRSVRKAPIRPSRVQIDSSDEEEGIAFDRLEGLVSADSD